MERKVFEMSEKMPCKPQDIVFLPYFLPGIDVQMEGGELALRLIAISQREGKWVGVTVDEFIESIKAEKEMQKSVAMAHRENMTLKSRKWKYKIFSVLTFGIYSCFVKKPNETEIPKWKRPFSIFLVSANYIPRGFSLLLEKGWMREEGEVYYLTPSLISHFMEVLKGYQTRGYTLPLVPA